MCLINHLQPLFNGEERRSGWDPDRYSSTLKVTIVLASLGVSRYDDQEMLYVSRPNCGETHHVKEENLGAAECWRRTTCRA